MRIEFDTQFVLDFDVGENAKERLPNTIVVRNGAESAEFTRVAKPTVGDAQEALQERIGGPELRSIARALGLIDESDLGRVIQSAKSLRGNLVSTIQDLAITAEMLLDEARRIGVALGVPSKGTPEPDVGQPEKP